MKKSSNDIVRSLFLMAAMIIIGAGSAFAQSENDYFSLTKNAGTESESTSYYTTFAEAVEDAKDGDKITLLQDYTATDGVSINKSITLDLNDHTYTGHLEGNVISVNSGATLTLVDKGNDKDKMGSIKTFDEYCQSAVFVASGGRLNAKGVNLVGESNGIGISNDGTAEIDDCVIHGKLGINIYGTATITKSDISGGDDSAIQVGGEEQEFGVVTKVYDGCLTIGKDVYISGYFQGGIGLERGKVILKALPTFERTRDPGPRWNIGMLSGCSLIFEEGTFNTTDRQPISICIVNFDPVDPATYTNAFTVGYAANVRDTKGVINPNDVFSWYDSNYTDGFTLNADGEVIFGRTEASITACNAGSAPTIANYTTLADALVAAQAGYVAGNGDDVEEFIPTVTLLADVVAKEKGFVIGDGKTTKMTLDLNDHNITGDKKIDDILIVINDGATLTLVDNGDDKDKSSIENNDELNHGVIFVASGGRLNAKGVIIFSEWDTIINYGTAEFDDCKISGKYAIDIYGTATITNSDIIGGAGSGLLVGSKIRGDNGEIQVYDGCLTIGEDVYISGYVNQGIEYQFGTVILKALPTFGERPTTSSTTRATTRDAETYDIAIPPGRSLTFEEGTFKTPDKDKPISIYIKEDGVPIDPAIYTNPITTNYSKYVKDGGKVIDPNEVFRWYGNNVNFKCGFRMNTAGEVIFDHAAVTVTSYDVDNSTVTTTPYYNFSEAIAAANSGYKTATETGGTEFIPTLKMLDDVSIDTGVEIGDGETTKKVTLDLNDKEISGAVSGSVFTVKSGATLTLVDNGTDNSKGMVWNSKNETGTNCIYVWNGGELTATGVSIKSDMGTALLNNGSTTVGEGVSFSGNREASIYNNQGTLALTAWPTFGGSETEGYADIKLYNGRTVTFGGTGLGTPTQKVTLRVVRLLDDEIHDISAEFLPVAITSNYTEKVKDTNGVIDPNKVFRWYNDYAYFGVALNADGETAIYAPTTFTFADGQEWMTWCDKNEWRLPDGIEAYCITGVTASAITIEKLTGTTIPAYTPVLLYRTTVDNDAVTAMFYSPATGTDGVQTAEGTGCIFYGNAADDAIAATDAIYTVEGGFIHVGIDGTGTASYVLRDGQFILVDENQGLAAHRCVLNVSAANNNARVLTINDDATGILSIENGKLKIENPDDAWYSIDGRKLDKQPTKKGLYIHGGRKEVIR